MTFVKQIAGAAILLGCSLSAPPARAAYIVDLTQVGSNVVATGSGTIDTAGLSFFQTGTFTAQIIPEEGLIVTGPLTASTDKYTGFTGPASFGSGGGGAPPGPSSGSGDMAGIDGGAGVLFVPAGYVSGTALMDTATYTGKSFSSLGATPGTYVWTWGSGANADSFTLEIGAAPPPPSVPEPSSLVLLGAALAGLPLVRISRRTIPKISN